MGFAQTKQKILPPIIYGKIRAYWEKNRCDAVYGVINQKEHVREQNYGGAALQRLSPRRKNGIIVAIDDRHKLLEQKNLKLYFDLYSCI